MAVISKHVLTTRPVDPPETIENMETLRGDCARMAPHWVAPTAPAGAPAAPVSPALIHGISVPPASARLIDGMSEYGD
ncbi:hypothetical protein ACGFSB_14125 [Streptomyces sp. NPDC048441]|uniref:hypothetical protein n=1 Tax=Streptomyces sp. NPDC048441 TaxID=3365552 RepID=UPI003713DD2C